MGKTVLFGGTFNPPHNAHLCMLRAAAACNDVDRVLVVPTNIPPHKAVSGYCAEPEQRLTMCRFLCRDIKKAEVSDCEIKRGGKSYTVDTLTYLKPQYGDLYLLIGSDMVTTFTGWYRFDEILRLAGILAVRRPGTDDSKFDSCIDNLRKLGGNVTVLRADTPDISSTAVRENESDDSLADAVPEDVYRYILENGLYGRTK